MKQIEKAVKKFHKLLAGNITEASIRQYILQQGYDIVYFTDADTEIFTRFHIDSAIMKRSSFTYIALDRKIVFIKSTSEKICGLMLEAAHIVLKHVPIAGIVGDTLKMKKRATLFSTILACCDFSKKTFHLRLPKKTVEIAIRYVKQDSVFHI